MCVVGRSTVMIKSKWWLLQEGKNEEGQGRAGRGREEPPGEKVINYPVT